VADDLAGDAGALERRHAGLDGLAVVADEDVVELDRAALFTFEGRDLVRAARLDTELLAAGLMIASGVGLGIVERSACKARQRQGLCQRTASSFSDDHKLKAGSPSASRCINRDAEVQSQPL
jgi:hypothetical protein